MFIFYIILIISIFIICINFRVFFLNFTSNSTLSWIPLLGGCLLFFSLYNLTDYNLFYLLLLSLSIDFGCLFGFLYNFLFFKFINEQVEKINIFIRYKNITKLKTIKDYIKTLTYEEKEKIILSQNFPHTLTDKQYTYKFSPEINNFFYIYQKIKIHNITLDISLFKVENLDLFQIGLYGKHPIFINIKNNQILDKPFFNFYKDNSINFYDYLLIEILYYQHKNKNYYQ